jgi:ADP-heptose:LPS heptosyltransferase
VVLALRALGLGDFLTGLPALGLIRQALPEHELVLAAPAVFGPLIPLAPAVDRLLPSAELAPVLGAPAELEIAFDLHGKGPESRRLLSALRPARLYGFADPAAGLSGPTWFAGEHEVRRWCRLVCQALGLPDRPAEVCGSLLVPPTPMPDQQTVLHPGAAAPARRWPAQRFAQVARELRVLGHSVVITGGGAEEQLARSVAEQAGVPALVGLSLEQLLALVARARMVICGDTGVAHLASSYRTPSVVLFGPVSPASWGPPPAACHRVLWHGDGTGNPHGQQLDPALREITVAQVLAAVAELSATGQLTATMNPTSARSSLCASSTNVRF